MMNIMRRLHLPIGRFLSGYLLTGALVRADVPPPLVVSGDSSVRLSLTTNHVVATGRFTMVNGWQTVNFSHPATGRYFCLEALSALDGKPYAAVAELEMLDETGKPISHQGWRIIDADSEEHEKEDGSATNAIDGNPATYWHTQWTDPAPDFPHRLVIDFGRSLNLSGFEYMSRPGAPNAGGHIKDYRVSLSDQLNQEPPPENLLPEQVYLFSYFNDQGVDGLHLAWSLDGYVWSALNNGQSVFSPAYKYAKLLRDPCLLRGPDGVFRLVWTCSWSGDCIGLAASTNLIHWSAPQFIPVMTNFPGTRNCWAPEIYWDEPRQDYLIIWSSGVDRRFEETAPENEADGNQRVYFTTTRDFQNFPPSQLYYNPGCSAIDPTVVKVKDQHYLIFKETTVRPLAQNLHLAMGHDLMGPFGPPGPSLTPPWVEGPTVYPVDGGQLCIYHAIGNNTWGALKSQDMTHWQDVSERLAMPRHSHPGTVLTVPRQVLLSLWRAGKAEIGPAPELADLGLGHWIWTDSVADKQSCHLWRYFEIPSGAPVSRAILRMTADNGYQVFLDGREIGRGGDYNDLTEYDLTEILPPGGHVLAVEGFNDALAAGVILGLHVQMVNGQSLDLGSDSSWRVVPAGESEWTSRRSPGPDWKPARVVGYAGKFDWERPKHILAAPPIFAQPTHFWQSGWFLLLILGMATAILLLAIRLGLKLAVHNRSQQLLERERDRIARDIHDEIGAGLTQLTLIGELVLRQNPPDPSLRQRLESLCGKSRTLLGSMDELVWTMNSRHDTVQDFAAFVCAHAQDYLANTDIRCRLDVPDELPATTLDLPARRNLLLAVKEAVCNAARHSRAEELILQIRVVGENLRVVVRDNGRGFDPAAGPSTRHGLGNMAERLADVGGTCRLAAAPGKGCLIVFTLPLTPEPLPNRWLAAWGIKFRSPQHPVDPPL